MRWMNWVRHTRELSQPTSSRPVSEHPRERSWAQQLTSAGNSLLQFPPSAPKQNYCTPNSHLYGMLNLHFLAAFLWAGPADSAKFPGHLAHFPFFAFATNTATW
jgi:hypothetical protein